MRGNRRVGEGGPPQASRTAEGVRPGGYLSVTLLERPVRSAI